MNLTSIKCDQAERGIGYGAGTVAALSFLVLWVPNLEHSSGHVGGATYLAIGLVLAGAVVLATLSGRLVALCAAMVFVGVGPWGPERLFQILYLLAAAWLVFRLVRHAMGVRANRAGQG